MGSSLNPAGIKKPSPGFILKADASLAPLNNAQIEVRAMSGARAPSRFPPSTRRSRGVSRRRLSRGIRRFSRAIRSIFFERDVSAGSPENAGWYTVGRPTGWFQFGFFRRAVSLCFFRERRALTRTLLLRRASLAPRDFFTSTNHRTASCIGPTTGCGTKPRWCL